MRHRRLRQRDARADDRDDPRPHLQHRPEDAAVRAGGWQHTIGTGPAGATLGVVGLGRLGAPVANLAQAFEMGVLAGPRTSPRRGPTPTASGRSRSELFPTADVVTIHMPLSDGIADGRRRRPGPMKPTAFLMNTSRGPIVDEAALVDALRAGRIAGAGLDVDDVEPLPVDHPLRAMRNTLLLPHIGYVTTDNYRTFFRHVVEDIVGFTAGTPVRVLSPSG